MNNRDENTWSKNWNSFISKKIESQQIQASYLEDDYEIDFSTIKTNDINYKDIQKGGRSHALDLLSSFTNSRSTNYQKDMSSPITGEKACSRLSPYITFGNISLKEIFQKIRLKML